MLRISYKEAHRELSDAVLTELWQVEASIFLLCTVSGGLTMLAVDKEAQIEPNNLASCLTEL